MPKFKPIKPNQADVASLRRKLMLLIRRMESDFENQLKPLIKKMGEQQRSEKEVELNEEIKSQLAKISDAVNFLTAYETAMRFHVSKQKIISSIMNGEIKDAILQDGKYLIPEPSVHDYGIRKGYIDPKKDLLDEFNRRIANLTRKYNSLIHTYQNMAENFTEKMYQDAKKQFMRQFGKNVGVDVLKNLTEKGLRQVFEAQVSANVNLIQSVPETYFGKLQDMIIGNATGTKPVEGGLINAIQELTHVTRTRAKTIARDQSAKAVSTFNSLRYQNLGSEEYIWRNSQDRRVAGNPNGLYPDPDPRSKVHGNHWNREGKVFRWDDPPPDGHPGMGINCRCFAEPIFNEE